MFEEYLLESSIYYTSIKLKTDPPLKYSIIEINTMIINDISNLGSIIVMNFGSSNDITNLRSKLLNIFFLINSIYLNYKNN